MAEAAPKPQYALLLAKRKQIGKYDLNIPFFQQILQS
jgi:hypothetical protein